MPVEQILSNAQLVTADRVFYGTVVLRDGLIAEVNEGPSRLPQALDLNGDYLLPGLVELHTDNLERHMTPRPGVDWPSVPAVLSHDAQIIAAGITTVFDAVSIGDVNPKGNRMQKLPAPTASPRRDAGSCAAPGCQCATPPAPAAGNHH